MKVDAKCNKKKYLEREMPPIQEQLDAIFTGGTAFAEMKQRVKDVNARGKK